MADTGRTPSRENTVEDRFRSLPTSQQRRLDELMCKNNEGQLGANEREELVTLVRAAEEVALSNARLLAAEPQTTAFTPE